MNMNVEKLKEELNNTLQVQPLNSEVVLELSKQLDILILEYYKQYLR